MPLSGKTTGLTNGDFDPSQPLDEEDVEMEEGQEGPLHTTDLNALEINILIYTYLRESGFTHSAFSLYHESKLPETQLFRHFNPTFPSANGSSKSHANGGGSSSKHAQQQSAPAFGEPGQRIPRGALVRKLWKALRYEDIERHVGNGGKRCGNSFSLLVPHTCPPNLHSAQKNPPKPFPKMSSSPPPRSPPAFPQDPEEPSAAGPSRRNPPHGASKASRQRQQEQSQRGSRRNSDTASSRAAVDLDEDDEMDGGDDYVEPSTTTAAVGRGQRRDRDKRVKSDDNAGLTVPSTTRPSSSRSKSPASRKDKVVDDGASVSSSKTLPPASADPIVSEKGQGNPLWIRESDIGIFTEHRDVVNKIAWNSKNPDLLASASNDSTARFWYLRSSSDPDSRALVLSTKHATIMAHKSIEANKKAVRLLSWHPEGTFLATAAGDGVGRMFTPNGVMEGILAYGRGGINAIKFSPSGGLVLTANTEYAVNLFDVTAGTTMKASFAAHTAEVNDVDWCDDMVFASGGNDHKICIFRIDEKWPHYTFDGHTDDVTCVKWSPSSSIPSSSSSPSPSSSQRYLASVGDDGKLMVWQMDKYPQHRRDRDKKWSRSVSPVKRDRDTNNAGSDPDDDYFTGTGGGGDNKHLVVSWQVVEGSENKRMSALEWSPERTDGRMLLAAGGQDSSIKIYDVISKSLVHTLSGFEAGTGSLSFAPAGFRGTWGAIAGGCWDATFKVWDVETGEVLKEYEMDEDASKQRSRDRPFITSTAWRPDGEHVAVSLYNKTVMTFYVGDLRRPVPASEAPAPAGAGEGEGAGEGGEGDGEGKMEVE